MNDQDIIEKLDPYVSDARKQRIEDVLTHRTEHLHVAIENPFDMHNALAVIRSAESFGILNVHIIKPDSDMTGIKGVSQGAYAWINLHWHDSLKDFLYHIKANCMALAGGVLHADNPVSVSDIPLENPTCLLFGNEHRGLSDTAKRACNTLFKIPMHGMTESLNLSVSAAISLFVNSQRATDKPLSENRYLETKAKYYKNSVSARLVNELLKE